MVTIKALGHRVLIKPDDIETQTAAGIVIVQNEAREFAAQEYGTIVDVGPTAWKDYGEIPWAAVGERVIFSKYGGKIVYEPGETDINKKFVIVNDVDVLAKLEV